MFQLSGAGHCVRVLLAVTDFSVLNVCSRCPAMHWVARMPLIVS